MKFRTAFLALAATVFAGVAHAQDIPVDYKKYPDAKPFEKAVAQSPSRTVTNGASRSKAYGSQRPDHLNNALLKFYPPVFNQSGGSCGSAQAVGYCMTYDMNSWRNTDASYPENQLPTHYTWLHTTAGMSKYPIMSKHGVPNVTDYGGRTYSSTFGNQDTDNPDYGYMQGYDKWYRAMFNRTIGENVACVNNQNTEAGREELKQWLWNRWGDESFYGGGIAGIGVASGGKWGDVPSTATNNLIGVTGKKCVSSWGKTFDHALTIVGYDDRIEFDLDSNGIYGEPGKDETGAWIICNSWGAGWCNGGFIYCPYKFSYAVGINILPLNAGHADWRKDYVPKRVFKVLMDYSHRSEISICAGVAADTSATEPEESEYMPYFHYMGDGSRSDPAPAVPMLGKWRTKYNYDPFEFGYDVTDLTQSYDLTKPLKYFLVINSKGTAIGAGHIRKFALMDYEIEADGVELPARIDSVAILNGGQTTIVSLIVQGRQFYRPLNALLSARKLTWSAPKPSSFNIARYYIYKGNNKIAEVPDFSTSYTVDDPAATYYVAAAYNYKSQRLVSPKSNPARNAAQDISEGVNKTLSLSDATLQVPNLLTEKLNRATLEFWIKPKSLGFYNQQVGDKWGTFLFALTKSGQIACGWDANNRVTSAANTIRVGNWYHVAITVDNNVLTLYVNGMKKSTFTSSTYSGFPAIGAFNIGTADGAMDAELDELRLWSTTRDFKEIFFNKNIEIANPKGQSDLLVYYPMNTYEADGVTFLQDKASGYDIPLTTGTTLDNATLLNKASAATADFEIGEGEIYAGDPVQFFCTSQVNTVSWEWSAPGATNTDSHAVNPYFTFAKAGDYDITLRIKDSDGNLSDCTKTITVVSPTTPKADFEIAADNLGEGEKFCLANMSAGLNCTYRWLTPGADTEELNCVNATVTYSQTGIFPITLVATNGGGSDRITKYVTVTHSTPKVAFTIDPGFINLGETTYLTDETRNSPSAWHWRISNGKHTTLFNGQNTSFTPKHPGIYTVTLEAANDIGSSSLTEQARLVVVNADSRNGLNFSGSEKLVSTASPFANGTRSFTIEWWMNPTNALGALNMTTENGQIDISTNADGNMSITIGDKTVKSGDSYVVSGEWHHYAITYSYGKVQFYRNGELIASPTNRIGTSTTAWGKLTLSGAEDAFKGQLDELRIWGKSLTLATMKEYINAPLNTPASLAAKNDLVAYYDFNQNGGNVIDRTGNGIDLERVGFGPDGDAWGLSQGVFTLDFDTTSPAEETLDADGLTHIYDAVREGKAGKYTGMAGGIRLVVEEAETVRIYNAAGRCVLNDTVEGVHFLPFEPGIYIVNGVKVAVR